MTLIRRILADLIRDDQFDPRHQRAISIYG